MEKTYKGFSGFAALFAALVLLVSGIYILIEHVAGSASPSGAMIVTMLICFVATVFILKGLVIVQPNYGITLTFFGKYVGTLKENGLSFVNPLFVKLKVSLRSKSLESAKLKVNDKMGNPIEIAAVILWQVQDTYKAVFEVVNFNEYMTNQSEACLLYTSPSPRDRQKSRMPSSA